MMAKRTVLLCLVAIMLVGAALRFYQIDKLSLTFVEAMSLWFSRASVSDLFTFIPLLEVIPPLYSFTLKAWSLFGDSEAALRSLSAVMNTMTIPLVFLIGRNIGGDRDGMWLGLGAALLFAVSPLQLQFAQESRYPATLTFAATIALTGLSWLITHPRAACISGLGFGQPDSGLDASAVPARSAWLALLLGTALSLWLHSMSVFLVAAIAVAALFWLSVDLRWQRHAAINLFAAAGFAFLLFAPFLPMMSRITGNVSDKWWMQPPDLYDIAVNLDVLFGVSYLHFLFSLPVMALALAGLWMTAARHGWSAAVFLAAISGLPVLMSITVSHLVVPVFLYRNIIWVTVGFYVLAAAGVTVFRTSAARATALALLALLYAAGSFNYHRLHEKQPWDEITAEIAGVAQPHDLVLVLPNAIELAFVYYAERNGLQAPVRVLPFAFPAIDATDHPYPTDITTGPAMIPADLPALREALAGREQVWLVTWLKPLFDPDDLIETLLADSHAAMEESRPFEDIVIRRFERR